MQSIMFYYNAKNTLFEVGFVGDKTYPKLNFRDSLIRLKSKYWNLQNSTQIIEYQLFECK